MDQQRPPNAADLSVLIFAMAFPSFAAWIYFVKMADSEFVQALYGLGKVLQFPLPIVWLVWVRGRKLALKPSWRGVGAGLLTGVGIAAVIVGVYVGLFRGSEALSAMPELLSAKVDAFGIGEPLRFIGFAIFLSLVHSFLEEYYWRWYVFGELRRFVGSLTAAVISSLAFMAHHVIVVNAYIPAEHFWTTTMPFSLAVALGGFIWCRLYVRSRSLMGPWVSHILADVAVMAVGYDQVFGG